jgi:hypothetical protein
VKLIDDRTREHASRELGSALDHGGDHTAAGEEAKGRDRVDPSLGRRRRTDDFDASLEELLFGGRRGIGGAHDPCRDFSCCLNEP